MSPLLREPRMPTRSRRTATAESGMQSLCDQAGRP